MLFTTVFFVLLVAAGLTFVLWPIRRTQAARTSSIPGLRESLEREKRHALLLLRDLDFDYRSGKILERDYRADRAEAEVQALDLLRRLDRLEEIAAPHSGVPSSRPQEAPSDKSDSVQDRLTARRRGLSLFLFLVCLAGAGAGTTRAGEVSGKVYTVDHPDSIAAGAELILVYRTPDGEIQHLRETAGQDGGFRFAGVSSDPEIAYVLRVDYRGRSSLGSLMQFAAGQEELRFDVLIGGSDAGSSSGAAQAGDAINPDVAGEGSGSQSAGEGAGQEGGGLGQGLPAGHPDVSGLTPATGRPVPSNPVHTVLLTSVLVALFGLPWLLLTRQDRVRERGQRSRHRAAQAQQDAVEATPRTGEGYGG